MARGRKKKEDLSEDERHPLDHPSELEASEESEIAPEAEVVALPEELPAKPAMKESKKISGSPLGKVRGKDLKNY